MLSFVLVQPKPGVPAAQLVERIRKIPGLGAFTSDEFFEHTIQWYVRNTGIPVSFGTVVVLGIIVGIAIAGQTFYLFIHENLRFMAALKAMGAKTGTLARMVFLQAFAVGFAGYGLGVGIAAIFGFGVLKGGEPPFYLPWQILVFTGAVIVFICCFSALIGLLKILRAEPAVVFK
jgi:putative ABC transport system permease protein